MLLRPLRFALAALLCLSGSVSAQTIRGIVGDITTQEPIPSALLIVVDSAGDTRAAAVSDARGEFLIRLMAGEEVRLRVTRGGYASLETRPISLGPSDSLRLEIGMRPVPIELEGVTGTAPLSREHARFIERQRTGFGVYLGPDQIAKLRAVNTTQLLATVPGGFLMLDATGRGLLARPLGGAGLRSGNCTPTVFVDGWEVPNGSLNWYASAPVVRAVEVYRNPANAPPEFQRAWGECTVVVIWTAYGFNDFR